MRIWGSLRFRPNIASKIRKEFRRAKEAESSLFEYIRVMSQLTPTELDILGLFVHGHTRREVRELRHVEESTLKSQIHSILQKCGKERLSDVVEQYRDVIHSVRG